MQTVQPSLFARDDTFFGVCEGIGQDLGISPNILRLAFVPPLFFYPVATIGTYLALGLVVLLSRLLFPSPSARAQREDCAAIVEQREESAKAGQRLAEPTDVTGFTPVTAEGSDGASTVPLAA